MMDVVTRRAAPNERYAQVNPVWKGEIAVVMGGGPSLTREQVDMCRGRHCIAVNDAYLWADFADVVYFADSKWFRWQMTGRDGTGHPIGLSADELKRRWRDFAGLKVSISDALKSKVPENAALFIENASALGKPGALSRDVTAITTGSNSGFQALNIAVLSGAARVILLGIDGKAGAGGKRHFFGDHPDKTEAPYAAMRTHFALAARECLERGVELINCSPGTAIDNMPCMYLEEALAGRPTPEPRPMSVQASAAAESSVYVRVSQLLRERERTRAELARAFPSGLEFALRKGINKGTFVNDGETWRHASVVAPTNATVV